MQQLKDVFTGATPRPVTPKYAQVTLAIQSGVSKALVSGKVEGGAGRRERSRSSAIHRRGSIERRSATIAPARRRDPSAACAGGGLDAPGLLLLPVARRAGRGLGLSRS